MKSSAPIAAQLLIWKCACGKSLRRPVLHYDVIFCRCGRSWLALQPLRNGPLKMFPRLDPTKGKK